jgi:histidyl-tRNA synthetase
VTLKGDRIAEEFQAIVDEYVRTHYEPDDAVATAATDRPFLHPRPRLQLMTAKVQGIRGMEDVLPDQTPLWQRFEDATRRTFELYGYRNIRTPIVEPTALFVRGLGEVTDIVEKEMYVFEDRNGESLALRPEATAGIVRSAIEHNFLYNGPMRVWTVGPMFRYERPQKGRQRQFHQFDVEGARLRGPGRGRRADRDARAAVGDVGIPGVELHINSIGDAADRKAHRAKLVAYFEEHRADLTRIRSAGSRPIPLRILDSKNPAMQSMIEGAPRLLDHLGEAASEHFAGLQALLDAAGVAVSGEPRLVRGSTTTIAASSSSCRAPSARNRPSPGGGRYDALFEQLGGKPTPACGFGMGIERAVLGRCRRRRRKRAAIPDAFVVHAGEAGRGGWPGAWPKQMRDAGLAVVLGAGGSFKSQMKKADASGARYRRDPGRRRGAVGQGEREAASPRRRATIAASARGDQRDEMTMSGSYDFEEQERIAELKGVVGRQPLVRDRRDHRRDRWHSRASAAGSTGRRARKRMPPPCTAGGRGGARTPQKRTRSASPRRRRSSSPSNPGSLLRVAGSAGGRQGAFERAISTRPASSFEWVVASGVEEHRGVARIRSRACSWTRRNTGRALASRCQHDPAFAAMAADLRGDVMLAQGRMDEARSAYRSRSRKPARAIP